MRSGMIAFSLGVVAVGFWPGLPGSQLTNVMLVLDGAMVFWVWKRRRNHTGSTRQIVVFAICLLTGVLWHINNANARIQLRLPVSLEGKDFLVAGYVSGLPDDRGIIQQFKFYIETSPNGFQHRTVLLNYYGDREIEAGQRWQFQIRLNRPHGLANPGGFDYEAWLFQQGISGKGYIRPSEVNRLLGVRGFSPLVFRQRLKQRILEVTDGLPQQAILLALTLGDRALLSDQHWSAFTATGTNHLVVVSGLHVGFVATICYLLLKNIWRLIPALVLFLPSQKAGAVAAIAGAALYSLTAGFSLPTQRALVMVAVFMLAKLLAVRQSPLDSILIALVFVLILDPIAALTAGFWLSFISVAALLLVFTGMSRDGKKGFSLTNWHSWGTAQSTVFIALLVPLSVWQGSISLISPLANSFAIPLVSWIVVPLCLLATTLLALGTNVSGFLFMFADLLLQFMLKVLNWMISIDLLPTMWRLPLASVLVGLATSVASLIFLFPAFANYRYLGSVLLLPLLFPVWSSRDDRGVLGLHVLDVGQGLASIVRTRNHVLVYDTGAAFADGFNTGTAVLIPTLAAMGIQRVDKLVVSHGDNDHAGGAAGLVENIEVLEVLSSNTEISSAFSASLCHAGQQWEWDSVQFRILHPPLGGSQDGNNSSCVLQVRYAEFSFLLPGDIEAVVERQLLRAYGEGLAADVLVAPHHGSNTSSTPGFIAAVDPQFVIFSAGYRNQFRHPAEKVVARFQGTGARQFDTSQGGMISAVISEVNSGIEVTRYRDNRPRYWH